MPPGGESHFTKGDGAALLNQWAERKVALNAKKYPVRLARGKADKYTELGTEKGTGSADGDIP